MKTILKLSLVVIVALFALTTCNLIKTIDVGWIINSLTEPAADSFFDINYDVSNSGKYDLSGVKLHFRILLFGVGNFDAVTPEFSLSQNQVIRNNILTVDLYPYNIDSRDTVTVVGVDMDKPSD